MTASGWYVDVKWEAVESQNGPIGYWPYPAQDVFTFFAVFSLYENLSQTSTFLSCIRSSPKRTSAPRHVDLVVLRLQPS